MRWLLASVLDLLNQQRRRNRDRVGHEVIIPDSHALALPRHLTQEAMFGPDLIVTYFCPAARDDRVSFPTETATDSSGNRNLPSVSLNTLFAFQISSATTLAVTRLPRGTSVTAPHATAKSSARTTQTPLSPRVPRHREHVAGPEGQGQALVDVHRPDVPTARTRM
jgi:hypothetical protein